MFIDESGFMLQPLVRRTWSMRGHTPELKAWDRHERLTAITASVYEAHKPEPIRMIFEIQRHNANATAFFLFLLHLHRELRNQMIVIWDRLSAHRKTERYFKQLECSWASFEYLPGYCPQLNPVEQVWSLAKYGHMSNWPAHEHRTTSHSNRKRVRIAEVGSPTAT